MGVARSFQVVSLKTGNVVGEFPFTVGGDLTKILQGIGTGDLLLDVTDERCPPTWDEDFLQWRHMALVLDERREIMWAGIPLNAPRSSPTQVKYPCATAEAYLQQRHVPDLVFTDVDQAVIARRLAQVCGDAVGMPTLEYDCPLTGVTRSMSYAAEDSETVYDRLQELAAAEDGFDWTIDVVWADENKNRVRFIFRTGYPHLGYRPDRPDHVFEYPGNMSTYDYDEPWGAGNAATHIVYTGDAVGGQDQPPVQSEPVVDTVREAEGQLRLEYRESVSGEISAEELRRKAQSKAGQLFGGQNIITFTAKFDSGSGTRLSDISMGDSARVIVKVPALTKEEVWVVVGAAINHKSNEYKPTIARLGTRNTPDGR